MCTDFFGDAAAIKADKSLCQQTKHFVSAVWSDTPCDHAASHGGCWGARRNPQRVRWFYGTMNKEFKPGPDTYHVCGVHSIGFRPDGTPVRVDGSPEDGLPVHREDTDGGP